MNFVLCERPLALITYHISENAATGPEARKRPYNNIPLENSGPVLAKLQSGSEDLARLLTAYNRDLFESGLLQKPLVVTANKIESAIRRDGAKRIQELSETVLKGIYSYALLIDFKYLLIDQSYFDELLIYT